jgi:pyruvate kinase
VPQRTLSTVSRPRSAHAIALLLDRLEEVRRRLLQIEAGVALERFGTSRESARNLLHYLALRGFDLRGVQDELATLGLSSLGRAEGHVLYNLDEVLARLYPMAGRIGPPSETRVSLTPAQGQRLLARNASRLFGPAPAGRATRIMVTLPTEAAERPDLLRELLDNGTDCVRINCAHDTSDDWDRMIDNVRWAERTSGRRCRVEMDLGGPRLRTGPLEAGPAVLKARPERDAFGRVVAPAHLHLVADTPLRTGPPQPIGELRLPPDWIKRRRKGEEIQFDDARGARRVLRVAHCRSNRVTVSLNRSSYFVNGTVLAARLRGGRADRAQVSGIEARPGRIRLTPGDVLCLTSRPGPGRIGHAPRVRPVVGLTIPGAAGRLEPGDHVWFDGGRIGGVVVGRNSFGARVRIDHAPPRGTWLRADQGVNLPDTELDLPPLTARDFEDLRFIVRRADLVGYSFVQSADQVEHLRSELRRLGRPGMGIVLKIETRRAFEQLPAILLAALATGPAAVMVARGDLAVEVGFERLAEVQEEILWLAEAAHLPAIWATQVLEGLAQSGIPSRAEVTDAAAGERTECVMLNKGPYLPLAVRALDSIVSRMQAHQAKKSARLRHLGVAERFLSSIRVGERLGTVERPQVLSAG